MPIFRLTRDCIFPPVELSEPDGILAVGGDLSAERLILAYESGIFPWYSQDEPILWWSPNPRFVVFPGQTHTPKSLRRVLNQNRFTLTLDRDFEKVMTLCGQMKRPGQKGTWITPEMLKAYIRLHEKGLAHSVEVWNQGHLAGGLYGVSLGRCFFGESMFSLEPDASKAGFILFAQKLFKAGFTLIDSQVPTPHVARLGGVSIPRDRYLLLLKEALSFPSFQGNWGNLSIFQDE